MKKIMPHDKLLDYKMRYLHYRIKLASSLVDYKENEVDALPYKASFFTSREGE